MANKNTGVKKKLGVMNWILLVVLIVYAVSMIALFLWGISTSLKTRQDFKVNKLGLPKGMPWEWSWGNFVEVYNNFFVSLKDKGGNIVRMGILTQLFNTVFYAGVSAVITTAAYAISSYLVAKYKYWFSAFVYTFVLVTMVIPIIGSTPAVLLLLNQLHLYDTWIGNFITKFNFLGMYFLVFHAAFLGVSNEYYEAATIDGANEYRIFFSIMLPLVMPTCYTITLIKFIELWNDYNTALLFMPTHPTLAYGVFKMSISTTGGLSSPPMKIASCMFLAIPILILFIALRNKILGNVSMGGVKE